MLFKKAEKIPVKIEEEKTDNFGVKETDHSVFVNLPQQFGGSRMDIEPESNK